jgi:hypothetical protein
MGNNKHSMSGLLLFLLLSAAPAHAEIIVASSVEWLSYSSDVIAVGRIVGSKAQQSSGAAADEECIFRVEELIKSPVPVSELRFTYRRFQQEQSAATWRRNNTKLLVFLSHAEGRDSGGRSADSLVPTSGQFPLSLVNLAAPGKYVVDINFKVLTDGGEIIQATRSAVREVQDYLRANGEAGIKRHYLEVPFSAEAHKHLFAGSTCYIYVPSFMSKVSRPDIY